MGASSNWQLDWGPLSNRPKIAEEAIEGTATSGWWSLSYFGGTIHLMAHLDHIGIAVSNLSQLQKLFEILGTKTAHTEPVLEQGVVTHFLPLELKQTNLELLEVTDPQGTVAKFIEKRGPGIHHLSFRLGKGQLDLISSHLAAEGYKLIYPQPKKGAHNMMVNFIHPSTAGGLLIEIMEPA